MGLKKAHDVSKLMKIFKVITSYAKREKTVN